MFPFARSVVKDGEAQEEEDEAVSDEETSKNKVALWRQKTKHIHKEGESEGRRVQRRNGVICGRRRRHQHLENNTKKKENSMGFL